MSRIDRGRLGRRIATFAAVLGAVLIGIWAAAGFSSGILFAIAIGVASAVAILSDRRSACARSVRRERER